MRISWKNYPLAVMAALLLNSCSSPSDTDTDPLAAIELQANLTTISDRPPFKDDLGLLRMVNRLLETESVVKGQDSVEQLGLRDSTGELHTPPKLKEIYFFPETSDTALINDFVQASTFNLNRDTAFSHTLDFRQNIVFVTTRPPQRQKNLYIFSLTIKDTIEETLILSLSGYAVPDNDAIAGSYWNTAVYEIPKSNYKRLAVIYNKDTTFFPLAKLHP